jgi:hypothetical protein
MSDIRSSLLSGLKEQLLKGYVSTSQAENKRNQALRILFNRMERMSDNMLLKTMKEVSEIGALDLTAVTGISVLEGRILKPGVGDRPGSNPVKSTGDLLEALEHVRRHMEGKATRWAAPEPNAAPRPLQSHIRKTTATCMKMAFGDWIGRRLIASIKLIAAQMSHDGRHDRAPRYPGLLASLRATLY